MSERVSELQGAVQAIKERLAAYERGEHFMVASLAGEAQRLLVAVEAALRVEAAQSYGWKNLATELDLKLAKLRVEAGKVAGENVELSRQAGERDAAIAGLRDEIRGLKAQCERLQASLDYEASVSATLRRDVAGLKDRAATLEAEHQARLAAQATEYRAVIEELGRRCKKFAGNLEVCQRHYALRVKEHGELRAEIDRRDAEIEAVRRAVADVHPGRIFVAPSAEYSPDCPPSEDEKARIRADKRQALLSLASTIPWNARISIEIP